MFCGLVHIVHRDPLVRDILERTLVSGGYKVKVWSAASSMLEADMGEDPVCALLSLDAGLDEGLADIERVDGLGANVGAVALAGFADAQTVVEALRRGACNFLEFPVHSHLLLNVVRDVFDLLQSRSHLESKRQEAKTRIATLSPREMEVFLGIVQGKQNKESAIDLGISPRTVEVYRANIMEKLDNHSLAALLKSAFLAGVLDDTCATCIGSQLQAHLFKSPVAPTLRKDDVALRQGSGVTSNAP